MPFMSGCDCIFSAKGSIERANIKGDNGQPCLVPLVIWKLLENMPSVNTIADGLVYNANIAELMVPVIPNLDRTRFRYPQWILPKAFSASKDRKREGTLDDSAIMKKVKNSSCGIWACWPGMKPTWSCFTREGRNPANLFAIMLAYIFRSTFNSSMGQKFCGEYGVFPGLGRVTIVAVSISGGNEALEAAAS